MSGEVGLLLAVLGLCLGSLATFGLRAFEAFSQSKLQELCEQQGAADRFVHISKACTRVAQSLDIWRVVGLAVCCCGATVWAVTNAPLVALIAFMLFAISAGMWIPTAVGRLWPEQIIWHGWRGWEAAAAMVAPLTWCGRVVGLTLQAMSGRRPTEATEESLEEEIRTMVTAGEREGLLEEEAREMIEGVFELSDADVGQIMTPRTEIIALPLDTTWDAVVKFAAEAGHTRLPVFDRNRDDIVGVLHIKDLLGEFAKPAAERRAFRELLRKPLLVPETKPVNELLQEFQRSRMLLAIVINEYGSVSGLVTIEDVLEEIVGEIADEHDEHTAEQIKSLGEYRWEAIANIRIADLNEQLGLELPDEAEYDTLGGFIFHELGHIPFIGETLNWRNVRFRVLEATRRRIHRVAFERISEPAADGTVAIDEQVGR